MRRLWETIRWLRPAQVFGRLWRAIYRPSVPNDAAIEVRMPAGNWAKPVSKKPLFSSDGKPTFLNHTGALETAADWDTPSEPRLWRYNLHYFEDLTAEDAADRHELHCSLIARWIEENPAPHGTGWEPFPTSLRIVNWIKWALAGNNLLPEWQQSLALQIAWLRKNLEWHLLGNHLFANAKALLFAGAYFDGEKADNWLETGLRILNQQIPEQILPDGGQFERSPMYHVLALEDVLDLINLAGNYENLADKALAAGWRETANKMLDWAATMRHPDGQIALFNDSAFGIAGDPEQLIEYAGRLGCAAPGDKRGMTYLRDSGYVRAEHNDAVLFADIGEIGPDYLPGHAHADTLSFELSLFGQRCIVDCGCSTYEVGEERLKQRGTDAHNTIVVDGQNSSEVWSSFRVARRARPGNISVNEEADSVSIAASHDGYQRLPGRVTHFRRFELSKGGLSIQDKLDGNCSTAVANFLLHPEIAAEIAGDNVYLTVGGQRVVMEFNGGHAIIEQPAYWHPEFGSEIPAKRVRVSLNGPTLNTQLSWTGRS